MPRKLPKPSINSANLPRNLPRRIHGYENLPRRFPNRDIIPYNYFIKKGKPKIYRSDTLIKLQKLVFKLTPIQGQQALISSTNYTLVK